MAGDVLDGGFLRWGIAQPSGGADLGLQMWQGDELGAAVEGDESAGEGRYELIQGWRRLSACRRLLEETGDAERLGQIPGGIATRGDEL